MFFILFLFPYMESVQTVVLCLFWLQCSHSLTRPLNRPPVHPRGPTAAGSYKRCHKIRGPVSEGFKPNLTLILLMWRIWWAPNNASKWQMGFNSAFKGLSKANTEVNIRNTKHLRHVTPFEENGTCWLAPRHCVFILWRSHTERYVFSTNAVLKLQ